MTTEPHLMTPRQYADFRVREAAKNYGMPLAQVARDLTPDHMTLDEALADERLALLFEAAKAGERRTQRRLDELTDGQFRDLCRAIGAIPEIGGRLYLRPEARIPNPVFSPLPRRKRTFP